MKKVLIILGTIVGVIALGNVVIAGAQNSASQFNSPMAAMMANYTGTYTGTMPYGRWMHGGTYTGTIPFGGRAIANSMGQVEQKVLDAVSQKLGMTTSDLLTALHSGQTLTQLAQSKNVSLSDLQSAADAARKAALDALVSQNIITQQQEDLMLAHQEDMRILGFGGMMGFGFGNGRGHMPFGMPNAGNPQGFMPGRGMHRFGFPGGAQPQPQQPSVPTPSNQG